MGPVGLLGLSAILILAAGCGAEVAGKPDTTSPPHAPRVIRGETSDYILTLPAGWHRARRNLTPELVDPRELLTVATYPLRYKPDARCRISGCPSPALNGFRSSDILLSIQERTRARPAASDEPIELEPQPTQGGCTRARVAWFSFTSFTRSRRMFYAFVVVGRDASPRSRSQLRRLVGSLRFTPSEVKMLDL